MIDPVRLRELSEVVMPGELARAVLLLTCPDPLTLARAVEVMGREPDERDGSREWWNRDAVYTYVNIDKYGSQCMVGNWIAYNPTVGQFACLVLAAKQGEKA